MTDNTAHAPVIVGDTSLPPGFDHPHASEEARRIAEDGMILRVQVGSGVHGTSVSGQDDRDEMGICLEPSAYVTGLARVPSGTRGEAAPVQFEQYQRHTVWDQPGGLANRSGAGDLDVVVYSARKWASLALAGNPTVLLVLFVPDEEVVHRDEVGAELVDNAHRFVSRLAAERFIGYLRSQRAAMTGEVGAHTNRPELVAIHGYDTKYAMHALRLGVQGVELLTTGRITLPVPEPDLSPCGPSDVARWSSRRSWPRSRKPRRGWSSSHVECGCPTSPTGPGSTRGCTARTSRTGSGAGTRKSVDPTRPDGETRSLVVPGRAGDHRLSPDLQVGGSSPSRRSRR